MRYYFFIGNPPPDIKKDIPLFEKRGLLKCLGIVEDVTVQWKEGLVAFPEFVIINLDVLGESLLIVMEMLKQLFEKPPQCIGITNTAEIGFQAFKLGFTDVLLTPRGGIEMLNVLLKNLSFHNPPSYLIRFNSFRDEYYLKPEEILYLKADNFTTDVYLVNGGVVGVLRTLKIFEFILPPQFLRIQKSIIINSYYLYHVNDLKKSCKIMGVSTAFKYSNKFIATKLLLNRWE